MSNSRLAFHPVQGPWYGLSEVDVQRGMDASTISPRKRFILPIHRTQDAPVQRMMNFLQPGTYIRPHCHPRSGAIETIVVLSGHIRFFIYSDKGDIIYECELKSGTPNCLIDIEDNVWHNFEVLTPDTLIFECKMGPYDAKLDKEFAPWSVPESF
jgi:cupin fold WbuC family metalloprotein